jgi:hypothetical protein
VAQSQKCKCIVVDASISRACGYGKGASTACSSFLTSMLSTTHKLVLTTEITAEYRRHQSLFWRTWQVSMYARKRVSWVIPLNICGNLDEVLEGMFTDTELEEIKKDQHLVEAAAAADKIVTSLDDVAWALFRRAALTIKSIRRIGWANPSQTNLHSWLSLGANVTSGMLLGFRP